MHTNFSVEAKETYDLMLDLARNDFAHYENVTKKDLEDNLRKRINEDMLEGCSLYQAYRRNKIDIFEMVEEVVNIAIGEDILNNEFVNEFVEVKNRGLGDNTAFYSEGGLLMVATFAGNHWDTDRQALDAGSEITLPKEWAFIHVYEEFERFLLGITTLDKMMDKIYKSFNKFFSDRLYKQFQSAISAVPSDFSISGNSEEAVGGLVDLVQAHGGYDSITIAGTKGALRKLASVVPDKMFASSQKEAKASTGNIGYWEGNKLMVIPQTLKPGTYELALDDTKLFIIGGDSKPIKFEYYGDSRTDEDTSGGHRHADATVDIQIQTKFGMGLVMPEYFGVFTFSN